MRASGERGAESRRAGGAALAAAVAVASALLLATAPARAASPLGEAIGHFEAGEYEAVVSVLRPVIDRGELRDPVENAQAQRVYGIACVLTGRRLPAEAAFLEWLKLEPRAQLDTMLVRPEVVDFWNQVRNRHRDELLREVERRRPRTAVLNLLPPAGQFQNNQRRKFALLLASELALGAISVGTYAALKHDQQRDKTFPDDGLAQRLLVVNWTASFALIAVLVYGAIDGFYHYGRINRELSHDADSLRAQAPPRLRIDLSGLAYSF